MYSTCVQPTYPGGVAWCSNQKPDRCGNANRNRLGLALNAMVQDQTIKDGGEVWGDESIIIFGHG
jgi:hypothetical protein